MGISGLLPLLKSIHQQRHLRDYAGETLGIDAYGWLHKGIIPCAIDLALGKPTTKYVDYVLHRVRMLQFFGVTPYLVFDGDYLPSKASTEVDREQKRAASRAAGLELLSLKKTADAHRELQKAVDVTPAMARVVIDACRKMGVRCIVAPYEADAQLYYLEKIGEISGVISEDSDLLVFGVKRLITKLDQYGECVEVSRDRFSACKDVSLAGWSDREFRMMCILSGCDYLDNIAGVGLKKAHGLVKRHKNIDKIVRAVQFDGNMRVPAGYRELFTRAEVTFLHQRVFCPREKKLVHCNDPDHPLDDEHLIYIGPDLDEDIARGVARGHLDPMTKAPLQAPHTPSVATNVATWTHRKAPSPRKNKSITSFFKPKSEAKPVSKPRPPAPRTPLQPRDPNLHPLRHVHSAPPLKMSTPIQKTSITTANTSNKRSRVVADLDDDPTDGEQSEFFKRKPQKSIAQPPKRPRFAGQADKENVVPSTPVVGDTPQKSGSGNDQGLPTPSPAVRCEPASVEATSVPTRASRATPPNFGTKEAEAKVAQGWKNRYGFTDRVAQKNAKLSEIIEKQREVMVPNRPSSLPRASASSSPLGNHLKRARSAPLKKNGGPFVNESDSSQEEWPEFVGVGKFSQSTASSQSSQESQPVKGLFGRFAFGADRDKRQ